MKATRLTAADGVAWPVLCGAFLVPTIDGRTGQAVVQLGDDVARLDAALGVLRALNRLSQPGIEPRVLLLPASGGENAGAWFVLEDAQHALLLEHWAARRRILPPAAVEEVQAVNALLGRMRTYTAETLAQAQAEQP